MYPKQNNSPTVTLSKADALKKWKLHNLKPSTKEMLSKQVDQKQMKVLVWCCGFEERFAGAHLFREAERQGFNVRITGSRTRPEEMLPELNRFEPDWVFCFANLSRLRPYYKIIREQGARLLLWYPDQCDRARDRMWKMLKGHADLAVFSILHTAQQYRELFNDVLWMPQYFDQQRCISPDGKLPTRLDSTKKIYDLCFIGSVDKLRQSWLDELSKHYKCNFVIHRAGGLNEIRGYQMAEAYAQAKITFNVQREQFLNPGPFITSNRAYNCMGSGAFFINHRVKQLDLVWKEGFHCVTHNDTLDDLKKKIDYFLTHEEEREAIAKQGQHNVLTYHTLEQRVKEYWEAMHLILEGRKPVDEDRAPGFGRWVNQ